MSWSPYDPQRVSRDKVFADRAVSPAVAFERGYRRWGHRWYVPLYQADPRFDDLDFDGGRFLWPARRDEHGRIVQRAKWDTFYRWSRSKARQAGTGIVMPKHALPDSILDAPLAQLRPDKPIVARVYEHDHADFNAITRVLHEVSKHTEEYGRALERGQQQGPMVVGPHEHDDERRYLLPPGPHGKRWDTHPRCTVDAFREADRVFLHLEGCLKLDALVSAGEVGADVPSVTMWNRREDELSWVDFTADADDRGELLRDDLRLFLEAYVRVPVIIVCDSDWKHNPAVATEAFTLRDVVRLDVGLQCVVAAPPERDEDYLFTDELGRPIFKKRGSDDFMRDEYERCGIVDFEHDGYAVVNDLVVAEPQAAPGFAAFRRDYERNWSHRGTSGRKQSRKVTFELALLEWYTVHCTPGGLVAQHPGTIAQRLNVLGFKEGPDAVRAATLRLEAAGALDIDGYYDDPSKRPKPPAGLTRVEREEWWEALEKEREERRKVSRQERPVLKLNPDLDLLPSWWTPTVGEVAERRLR